MKKMVWEVRTLSPPPALHYCKKCGGKTTFTSSEQFRVNAQKKTLDIWLIYKCAVCDTTWNIPLYSRVNPKALDPALLERFHTNDEALARAYALDAALLRRCGGEPGRPSYTVLGDCFPREESVELHIHSDCESPLKVSAIVREKLGLSQRAYEEQLVRGVIQGANGEDLRKCKLRSGIVLMICVNSVTNEDECFWG